MSDQSYTHPNGPSDQCVPEGPTPNEVAVAQQQADAAAHRERVAREDKPLEQDGYDEGIMGMMGGLASGLVKGGLMGLGGALASGPAKQLGKALGLDALGSLFDPKPAAGTGGQHGGPPTASGGDGAGGAPSY